MDQKKIPTMDIHVAAYCSLMGVPVDVTLIGHDKVIFEIDSEEGEQYIREYSAHPSVDVVEYVSRLKHLKAKMYSMKQV
jgi:hypothetical protein